MKNNTGKYKINLVLTSNKHISCYFTASEISNFQMKTTQFTLNSEHEMTAVGWQQHKGRRSIPYFFSTSE